MENDAERRDLTARFEMALQQSRIDKPELVQKIRALLHRSLEYGRAQKVLGENPEGDACREYVDKIYNYYQKHHALVASLDRGETEAWTETIKKIHIWATSYFAKRNIHGRLRKRCVEECIPNAVLAYLSGNYLYDTNFDAWFCVLVQNVCRKYIQDQLHPNRTNQKDVLSYDKFDFLIEVLADEGEIASKRVRELRYILLGAIEKLSSDARQELIILHYFSGFSFKEIAGKMNRTLNATYKLHFDALRELREILENWY